MDGNDFFSAHTIRVYSCVRLFRKYRKMIFTSTAHYLSAELYTKFHTRQMKYAVFSRNLRLVDSIRRKNKGNDFVIEKYDRQRYFEILLTAVLLKHHMWPFSFSVHSKKSLSSMNRQLMCPIRSRQLLSCFSIAACSTKYNFDDDMWNVVHFISKSGNSKANWVRKFHWFQQTKKKDYLQNSRELDIYVIYRSILRRTSIIRI